MYRSHRRIRDNENEEEEGYQSFADDLHLFEGDRGLDVNFKLRVLSDLLHCPLCHGYFREAFTVKECLHTFCKSCIYQYIANGHNCCPVCNELLAANIEDGIGYDRLIQNLVDKLFPQFAIIERVERQNLYEFCGIECQASPSEDANSYAATPPSCHAALENPSNEAFLTLDDDANTWNGTREYFRNVLSKNFKICTQQNMAIALFPYDKNTKPLQRPYIRTASQMQVYHVMQYLAGKLGMVNPSHIELTLEGQIIHKTHTLEFVCKSRRLDANKCILIKYRVNIPNHKSAFQRVVEAKNEIVSLL